MSDSNHNPPPLQGPYATPPGQPEQTMHPAAAPGSDAGARTNVLAIIALCLSIAGAACILPFVGSVAGAITGHVSRRQIAQTGEQGSGMATAAIIVGWIFTGLWLVGGFAYIGFLVFGVATAMVESGGL